MAYQDNYPHRFLLFNFDVDGLGVKRYRCNCVDSCHGVLTRTLQPSVAIFIYTCIPGGRYNDKN